MDAANAVAAGLALTGRFTDMSQLEFRDLCERLAHAAVERYLAGPSAPVQPVYKTGDTIRFNTEAWGTLRLKILDAVDEGDDGMVSVALMLGRP